MKNCIEMRAFDGLISKVDIAKETISELEGKSTEILQTEMQKNKKRRRRGEEKKNRLEHSRTVG